MCWRSAGWRVSPQCSRTQLGAEPIVVPQARGPVAEVRDDRAAAVGKAETAHRSRSSRVTTPSGEPSGPTTRSASRRSATMIASASRRLVSAGSRGSPSSCRRRELQLADGLQRERLERPVAADEVGHELVHRVLEDLLRRVVLGEPAALAEDRDAVADLDRLVDVVRDEDDRLAQLLLQAQELVLEPRAHDRVDRAERLVHQHQRRVRGERAREADALALAAGELGREALPVRLPGRGRRARAARRRAPGSAVRCQPSSRGTVPMFPSTVMCGKRPTCWMT